MSNSYYIYYRVDPLKMAVAERRIAQLLDSVKASTGVGGRVLKKRGEPNLWMEVYENVAETAKFECGLADAVNQSRTTEFLQSSTGRHMESFED